MKHNFTTLEQYITLFNQKLIEAQATTIEPTDFDFISLSKEIQKKIRFITKHIMLANKAIESGDSKLIETTLTMFQKEEAKAFKYICDPKRVERIAYRIFSLISSNPNACIHHDGDAIGRLYDRRDTVTSNIKNLLELYLGDAELRNTSFNLDSEYGNSWWFGDMRGTLAIKYFAENLMHLLYNESLFAYIIAQPEPATELANASNNEQLKSLVQRYCNLLAFS